MLAFSITAQAKINTKNVDPTLVIVSQGYGFRVLVYSKCSPEHCWSETYIQSVSFSSETPQILHSRSSETLRIYLCSIL